MDTDIHLDTSWCPVCDCLILPKKYTVPVNPPPTQQQLQATTSSAVRSSQTTRGKNGTIKARAGGGLVQGTGGRVRPALNRAQTSKAKSPLRTEQQLAIEQDLNAPVRTRTVIDQSQTPLYCSDECRQQDLDDSWPIAPPTAQAVLQAPPTPITTHRSPQIKLGAHPSQMNPALASPPPPSPTLPPVPPNSFRAPRAHKAMRDELNLAKLNLSIREADEHSDSSSSATGTSFTASDRSPIEEQVDDLFDNSNLYTDPQPPPLPDLPLHPHRPSAPVAPLRPKKDLNKPTMEGGMMMAARRLSTLFNIFPETTEQARQRRREKEEQERKEEEFARRCDLTGELRASGSDLGKKKKQEEEEPEMLDHARWSELVYNYGASTSSTPGVPSTHRRASDSGPKKPVHAPGAPSRTQSAIELYEKFPHFMNPNSSASKGGLAAMKASKSSASIATSQVPVYGVTTSSSSSKSVRSTSSDVSERTASVKALPGWDPELYVGKRPATGRKNVAEGLEGKLVLPEVMLRPPPLSSSSPARGMKRSGSEASVSRRGERSTSVLGAVSEDGEGEMGAGAWYRPEEERSEDSRSSATRSSGSAREGRKGKKSGSSKSEGKRPAVVESTWSYENGPVYDAMPPVPVKQKRAEEVFVPDEPAIDPLTGALVPEDSGFIAKSLLHTGDVEISRVPVRELSRRRGEHEGVKGWWVEKEWEVTVYPERKKLFLFGGKSARATRVK